MSDRRRAEGGEKAAPLPLPDFTAGLPTDFPPPDLLKWAQSFAVGWREVNASLIAFAQQSLERQWAAAEELRQVQGPKELLDLQLRMARRAYDDYIEEAGRIGQIWQKISTEANDLLLRRTAEAA